MTIELALANIKLARDAIYRALQDCDNPDCFRELDKADKFCAEARKNLVEWRTEKW